MWDATGLISRRRIASALATTNLASMPQMVSPLHVTLRFVMYSLRFYILGSWTSSPLHYAFYFRVLPRTSTTLHYGFYLRVMPRTSTFFFTCYAADLNLTALLAYLAYGMHQVFIHLGRRVTYGKFSPSMCVFAYPRSGVCLRGRLGRPILRRPSVVHRTL